MSKLSGTFLCLLTLLSFGTTEIQAQDSSRLDKLISLPDKLFGALHKKARGIGEKLDKQTARYLSKLQKQEHQLKKQLEKKDSLLAQQVFGDIDGKYEQLKNTSGKVGKYSSVYSGHLDSLTTTVNFLQSDKLSKLSSNPLLDKTLSQYKDLQSKLNASDVIKKQLMARQAMLKTHLEKVGMIKELKQFKKQVHYYQAQVKEYKEIFEDPNKMEAKLMELVMKIPKFKEFFANNSMLGSLVTLPGSTTNEISLYGLQTRPNVNQSITDRFGTGPNVTQALQQNVQSGQSQINEIKDRLNLQSSGSVGNASDVETPDFKTNSQKTKTFLQRLEVGTNFQSQKARYFFPITSDLGVSLGYRLNEKASIGLGASYKLGLGTGWNNISITHQGIGIRSYIDMKVKGSFFLTGGYEQNHRQLINTISQLRDESAWQKSGLIGLSKRYKVSKKMKGEMKLLWDFLASQQIPKTQSILFRIGYSLK